MSNETLSVIPVATGIQFCGSDKWIRRMGSRFRGNDNLSVIPVARGNDPLNMDQRFRLLIKRVRDETPENAEAPVILE